MFSTSDTIVAIATPPGRGGIGVVRVSGPDAHRIAALLITHHGALEPRRATFSYVTVNGDGGTPRRIDHVVATYFPAPASYTGDDVVELSAHGSPVVLREIVEAAIGNGARLAEPGEFTLRAYLNGRLDLPQAEAVADLIDAVTPLQARAAFDQLDGTLTGKIREIDEALFELAAKLEASVDFPDEGYHFVEPAALAAALAAIARRTGDLLAAARRGRLVREGLRVAIVGAPNAGKSSVFNALVGASRAIVTDVPGTTRDLVSEVVDVDGVRVTLVDTAGLRDSDDPIEAEGMARARGAQRTADLVLAVHDVSQPFRPIDGAAGPLTSHGKELCIANKIDLPRAWTQPAAVEICATDGTGVPELRARIAAALDAEPLSDVPSVTNVRHIALIERAHAAIEHAVEAIRSAGGALSEEFVLADLQDARAACEEIAGRRAPEDLLAHIFSRFCIGK